VAVIVDDRASKEQEEALLVWASFGLLVYVTMGWVRTAAENAPWLPEHAWAGGAAILPGAGLYQFSPLKYACLERCRPPFLFLTAHWKGQYPARESLALGMVHGAYCVGCCWSLMLVMFVAGMGSLAGMLALGAAMGAEKNFPWGRRWSQVLGGVLIAAAVVVAAAAV